jgi:hypothetical protein
MRDSDASTSIRSYLIQGIVAVGMAIAIYGLLIGFWARKRNVPPPIALNTLSLHGSVVDAQGTPIAGATLNGISDGRVLQSFQTPATTTTIVKTKSDGSYDLKFIRPGERSRSPRSCPTRCQLPRVPTRLWSSHPASQSWMSTSASLVAARGRDQRTATVLREPEPSRESGWFRRSGSELAAAALRLKR